MTSRLKRKLDILGVDTTSSKANESFCLIGTPLPPLEKSKDTGEFVPLWKQEVRDEKGRRRLHGAFTGGFSAGYFNSVGSAEGWTPSNFVSSRGDRAKQKKVQRPEDFMDEEDKADMAESRELVDTHEETDLFASREAKDVGEDQDPMALAIESALLPTAQDSAGARLLKKMGWRPGQGVGPRVSWKQRKLQDARASAGPSLADINQSIPDDDVEANKHLYAPRDTMLPVFSRKDNSHGLGYTPGASLDARDASGSKGPNISAGFGLGALNDADEDDVDVYDLGAGRSKGTHMAYDVNDVQGEDSISISRSDQITGLVNGRSAQPSTKSETFRDGHPVLPGFVLSAKPVAEDLWFPLPDVPKNWTPNPRRVWENKENDPESILSQSRPSELGKWKSGITADERGAILGETPLPTAPRSVFDYLSQKDRDRLKTISANLTAGSAVPLPTPTPPPPLVSLDPQTAKAALAGFQPFQSDPAKQARYTAYLQNQAFLDSDHPPITPILGQATDAFNKEVSDFAKAAQIFKPMSGAMANRFTSAAVMEQGPIVHIGLHTPSAESSYVKEAASEEKQILDEDPKVGAAKAGMFGALTREVKQWQPSRLLCKRFGVKDPNPEPVRPEEATPAAGGSSSTWQPEAALAEGNLAAVSAEYGTSNEGSSKRRDLSNIGLGDDDDQGKDTLSYERPSRDIFKAIFADDEDVSADEADEVKAPSPQPIAPPPVQPLRPPSPVPIPVTSGPADVRLESTEASIPDMSTFKPTFVPRQQRDSNKAEAKKDKKKKSGKKALVSFGAEEEDGMVPQSADRDRPTKKKKKKSKESRAENDDDDGMWVEKPAPEIVKNLPAGISIEEARMPLDSATDAPSKRKRAIDFM